MANSEWKAQLLEIKVRQLEDSLEDERARADRNFFVGVFVGVLLTTSVNVVIGALFALLK